MTIDYAGCLGKRLDRVASPDRPILACYFSMGDPLFDDRVRDIYAQAGVDIFELGIPTPNPYLDGPDIAGTMARALAGPVDPYDRMREVVAWLRARADRPAAVCMAYADLDLQRIDRVTREGLDGLLMVGRVDRIDQEAVTEFLIRSDIRDCGLVPSGFSVDDARRARDVDGYVMIQASSGVTGPRAALDQGLDTAIAKLRQAGISRPIVAGFGIGSAEQARQAIMAGADGVVIGSMCVRKVLEGRDAIRDFLVDVRSALDA